MTLTALVNTYVPTVDVTVLLSSHTLVLIMSFHLYIVYSMATPSGFVKCVDE